MLIEGFRPGVDGAARPRARGLPGAQPALVYGRMTGWGQDGPLAGTRRPRHHLHRGRPARCTRIGRAGGPPQVAAEPARRLRRRRDVLPVGVLAALLARPPAGAGQVVDAAIVDGAALLTTMHARAAGAGVWGRARVEPARHRRAVLRRLRHRRRRSTWRSARWSRSSTRRCCRAWGWPASDLPDRPDPAGGRSCGPGCAAASPRRTRAEWVEVFAGTDACVAPGPRWTEAPEHPHLAARGGVRRGGRGDPARAGAAVLPHPGRPGDAPGGDRRAHPRRPGGLGPGPRADRAAARIGESRDRPPEAMTRWRRAPSHRAHVRADTTDRRPPGIEPG